MIYNEQQEEALSLMVDWAKMKTYESQFTLMGSAGTGKTTVTKEFIKRSGYKNEDICVSAPTHKAKEIISKMTSFQGITLQALLGLRLDTDFDKFDPNQPSFSPQAEPLIGNYKLVVIDEVSMINKSLCLYLKEQTKIFGVKLLFLGDPNQLPPIKEKLSLVFTDVKHKYTLTKIERQNEDNPLSELLKVLKNDIEKNTNHYISYLSKEVTKFNEKGEGYLITKHLATFQEYVTNHFLSNEFNGNIDYCKFLAYTNKNVTSWNNYIRAVLFKSKEPLVEGDLLLCYKTYIDKDKTIITSNSKDYIVKSVTETYSSLIDCDCLIVDLFDTNTFETKRRVFVKNTSYSNFKKSLLGKINDAKVNRKKWKNYFDFKANYMLLDSLFDTNDKLITVKDFDYGYGLTVHKSQGSTYDVAFINVNDILTNFDAEEKRKLLYVALSRASKKVFIII